MNADGAPRRRGGDQFIPRPDQWRLGGAAPWASGRRPHGIRLDELLDVVRARVPGRLARRFPMPATRRC
ncbi:MAG: hypothetical protein R2713_21980 [Ilumatobacteraceae bacterium]